MLPRYHSYVTVRSYPSMHSVSTYIPFWQHSKDPQNLATAERIYNITLTHKVSSLSDDGAEHVTVAYIVAHLHHARKKKKRIKIPN